MLVLRTGTDLFSCTLPSTWLVCVGVLPLTWHLTEVLETTRKRIELTVSGRSVHNRILTVSFPDAGQESVTLN